MAKQCNTTETENRPKLRRTGLPAGRGFGILESARGTESGNALKNPPSDHCQINPKASRPIREQARGQKKPPRQAQPQLKIAGAYGGRKHAKTMQPNRD